MSRCINLPKEVLSTISGNCKVTKSGYATVILRDITGKFFKYTFEARCAPEANIPNEGILSCPEILNSCHECELCMSSNSGTLKLPDEDGRIRKVKLDSTSRSKIPRLRIYELEEKGIHLIQKESKVIHDALGHLSGTMISHAFEKGWITGNVPQNFKHDIAELSQDCYPCKLGNGRNKNHGKRKFKRTQVPLELLHMDVTFGPSRNSLKTEVVNHSACLVVTDEATRFQFIYAVESSRSKTVERRSLADALSELKRDIALIDARRRSVGMTEPIRVRGIHSDGGSDIKSVFKEFCDEHGMRFSTSDVAHPWQNGLAERSNQAIKSIAKKVLMSGNVPTEFWVYAMRYAATARNIVGVKVHGRIQSPFYLLTGQGVDIKDLHPFGCRAFVSKSQFVQNLSKQHPASRPDWKLSRFPVWFIGYESICLQPKRYFIVVSNRVLDRVGPKKAHIKVSSEVIFDESSYVNEQKALVDELNRSFNIPQGGLHDRRELDDWLDESSLHGDVAETATQGMCEESDSDSASLRDDFDGNRLDTPTGIEGRLEQVRSQVGEGEQANSQAKLTPTEALRDIPGWGPDGYSHPGRPPVNEGGVGEASDPPTGTDQPASDIAHIINHFRFNRTVSEGELRQNHIYLVSKYGSYLHTQDSLDEDADVPKRTHEVHATAVASADEYHKVIDEDAVDYTTSRDKELKGLLEKTLEAVRLEETSDANICGTKWVDKVKPDGSLKSRLVVQGFTQVWLKDYHDTFSAVATLTTFRIMINFSSNPWMGNLHNRRVSGVHAGRIDGDDIYSCPKDTSTAKWYGI